MAACAPFRSGDLPAAFPLNNTGSICHFNALLQALASCPAFVKAVCDNRDYMAKTVTGSNLYNYIRAVRKSAEDTAFVVDARHSALVLQAMKGDLERRCTANSAERRFGSAMESASEGLALLLSMCEPVSSVASTDAASDDAMAFVGQASNPISQVFMQRTVVQTWCEVCFLAGRRAPDVSSDRNHGVVSYRQDIGYQRCIFARDPTVNTPAKFAKALVSEITKLLDYKCELCMAEAKKQVSAEAASAAAEANLPVVRQPPGKRYRSDRMVLIPPVLQIMFNQYGAHTSHYFPTQFHLTSKTGSTLVYRVVAQVEHSGNLRGGHYWAHALRQVPNGAETQATYILNDSSVAAGPALGPTRQTYLVFYHFDHEKPAENKEN